MPPGATQGIIVITCFISLMHLTQCFDVKESFTKEVAIYLLNLFHHPNVLKFLTFVENTEEKNYWIVFEYHEKGSLYSLVQRKAVTLKEFCALSESIACGERGYVCCCFVFSVCMCSALYVIHVTASP